MFNGKTKLYLYVGMFGSGKTELSLNTAIFLREKQTHVAIADIDIISPYFRSRDEKSFLEEMQIKMVTVPERYMHADLPIIPPEVGGYISNPDFLTVVDVGGNEDGAIVLGSLKNFIDKVEKSTFFVVNIFRPFSSTKSEIISNIDRISRTGKIKIDYLVNNSNVGSETKFDDIKMGEEILTEVSKETSIPLAFTSVDQDMDYEGNLAVFKIKRFMKNPW
ncbi:cobalamin biosynthesis protein CobQ [Athalassotoga sp.]|uniref:cobalamin biosynthesis protein CobQ n=1 Tax=Athalassotoga sp. TaxID=2022597 RepID=UPI003D05674F